MQRINKILEEGRRERNGWEIEESGRDERGEEEGMVEGKERDGRGRRGGGRMKINMEKETEKSHNRLNQIKIELS